MRALHASSSLFVAIALLASSSVEASPHKRDHRNHEQDREPTSRRGHAPVHVDAPAPAVEVHVESPVQVHSSSTEHVTSHSATTREVVYQEPAPQTSVRSAHATEPEEPDRLWHLGFGMGGGPVAVGLGGSLDIYAGLRIGRFALQGEYWLHGRGYFSPGEGLSQQMIMLTAQLWLQEKLWVKTGVGTALLADDDHLGVARGTSLMAGAGYDIIDTRHVVFNAHVKAGVGLYRERGAFPSMSAGLGLVWY